MLDEENTFVQEPILPEGAPEETAIPEAEETVIQEEISQPSKKKKKLLPLFLGIIAAIIVVIIAIVVLSSGKSSAGPSAGIEPVTVEALMNDDGTAYIPLYDGTCITINDEVEAATLTKDRMHIVVMLQDGTLYVTDSQQSSKTVIADNAFSVIAVKNDGFLYKDKDEIAHRVYFTDFSNLEIGKDIAVKVAENTLSVVYATDEGHIYTLPATATEATKVGSFENTAKLEGISDDGQISVWADKNDSSHTIYLNEGDNRENLGTVNSKYDGTYVTFTDDQKLTVITNYYSDKMWIKAAGGETIEVKLAAETSKATVYTGNGQLCDDIADNVKSLYITTEGDSGDNLYNITLTGDRERVLSKIGNYAIVNGILFYTDSENDLFYGKISGAEIQEPTKISSDVDIFNVTENGNYVYYAKNYEDETATLYCYKLGTDEPVRVASEVACYKAWNYGWTYNVYSTDGATVFYFKDLEDIEDTYSDHGTLMAWTYGNESSQKIAGEVLTYSIESGISQGNVKANSLMFLKYTSTDADENIYANWMYYNGSETIKIAADVIK